MVAVAVVVVGCVVALDVAAVVVFLVASVDIDVVAAVAVAFGIGGCCRCCWFVYKYCMNFLDFPALILIACMG